jgi:hypothetical protein
MKPNAKASAMRLLNVGCPNSYTLRIDPIEILTIAVGVLMIVVIVSVF